MTQEALMTKGLLIMVALFLIALLATAAWRWLDKKTASGHTPGSWGVDAMRGIILAFASSPGLIMLFLVLYLPQP